VEPLRSDVRREQAFRLGYDFKTANNNLDFGGVTVADVRNRCRGRLSTIRGSIAPAEEEESMGQVVTIGLDLAKSVFQVHGVDAVGEVVVRRQIRRSSSCSSSPGSRPVLSAWKPARLPIIGPAS
jgi:hypothetical protein